ncbi:hypothetical protein BGZ83_004623, partial [Gryganskiella cystojenkinii]
MHDYVERTCCVKLLEEANAKNEHKDERNRILATGGVDPGLTTLSEAVSRPWKRLLSEVKGFTILRELPDSFDPVDEEVDMTVSLPTTGSDPSLRQEVLESIRIPEPNRIKASRIHHENGQQKAIKQRKRVRIKDKLAKEKIAKELQDQHSRVNVARETTSEMVDAQMTAPKVTGIEE